MKNLFKKILLTYAQRYDIKCGEMDIRTAWQQWHFNGKSEIVESAFTYVGTMLDHAPTDATHIRFDGGMVYFHKVSINTWSLGQWDDDEIELGEDSEFINIDKIRNFMGGEPNEH